MARKTYTAKPGPRCFRCTTPLVSRSGAEFELPANSICKQCYDEQPWLTNPVFPRAATVRRAA